MKNTVIKQITNNYTREKFLDRIKNNYNKFLYTRKLNIKLSELYNKIDIKDIYVKQLNEQCSSKFWTDYFISSETKISNVKKIKKEIKKKM